MKKFLIEFICWYVVSLFILEILTPKNITFRQNLILSFIFPCALCFSKAARNEDDEEEEKNKL